MACQTRPNHTNYLSIIQAAMFIKIPFKFNQERSNYQINKLWLIKKGVGY